MTATIVHSLPVDGQAWLALSIVRDLIRLYDPGLEQSGALKELVKGIENGASQSTNSWVQSNTTKRHRRIGWAGTRDGLALAIVLARDIVPPVGGSRA